MCQKGEEEDRVVRNVAERGEEVRGGEQGVKERREYERRMGKRKKASKPPPKAKRPTLEKVFDCPFCGHEQCVECDMKRAKGIGKVECRLCKEVYEKKISHLDDAIDVYSDWVDAIVEANKSDGKGDGSD
mmetsp:Transcript_4910/g.13198  ORF Transcript_4910/g.13198 Transcript_4910/m.13198 type:complete len:130 (-) Transcript_4910:671-1060(-)